MDCWRDMDESKEHHGWESVSIQGLRAPCHIDGLMQERRNSSALAMELRLSCINDWLMQGRRNTSALAMELRLSCINPSI